MKTPGARGNIHSLKVDSGLSHPLPHLLRHRSVHPVYVTNPQENTVSEQIHLTSQDDSLRDRVIAQRTLSQENVSVTINDPAGQRQPDQSGGIRAPCPRHPDPFHSEIGVGVFDPVPRCQRRRRL